MKKTLFRTVLVLAALTACNKEVETLAPIVDNGQEEATPSKVTLTFTAAISEETRTTYTDDKTASWEANDAITVCVTNGTIYEIADFTTTDGETFTGQVTEGFTTIVSGIYPANDVYQDFQDDYFTNGAVTAVFLPHAYNLEDTNDTGKFIPLVGSSNDGETLTFHHFCSAMKVTLTNIPDDATLFTFTTNKQQITTDFAIIDGRISLPEPNDGTNSTVSFRFEATSFDTRSFYIPIPDGSLIANSYVTIQNDDEDILFKKIITTSPSFGLNSKGKDAIRVLPSVACWTKNEDWNAYYFGPYKSSGKIYKRICLENMTGSYNYEVLTNSQFNDTYHGSAADYLSSTHFSTKISGLTTSYSSSGLNLNYNTLPKGKYYVMLFGLDQNLKFTGEYNCVEVVNPTFSTPEGWSISVVDDYRITYTAPAETKWQYVAVNASTFESTYLSDLEYLIYKEIRDRKGSYESNPSSWAPRSGSQSYTVAYNGDYVLLCIGIDDNYRPTGEYCRLDYSFPIPTDAYNAWIGKWTVVDNGSTQNTDTWTITRRQANHSYTVKGLFGYDSSYSFEIKYNDEDGSLVFPSQIYNTSNTLTYWLVGSSSNAAGHQQGEYNIMQCSFNENDSDHATLVGLNSLTRYYTISYKKSDGSYNGYYKVRYLPSTLTRVTE